MFVVPKMHFITKYTAAVFITEKNQGSYSLQSYMQSDHQNFPDIP